MTNGKIVIGIDEAGRGPLAGPVAVGALALRSARTLNHFLGVKDSKQLSEKQREEWFARIKKHKDAGSVDFAVSFCSARVIDKHGISKAVYLALNRCLVKLEKRGMVAPDSKVLMDGLLKASARYKDQRTIIGGDESEPVIALASICAKVLRDRKMKRLAKKHTRYGFDAHKGYGTKEHYLAIRKFGILPIHRKSYLKSILARQRMYFLS